MAAEDAFDAEPSAFEDSVFEYRFDHVLAASRCVAAGRRCERGYEDPIEIDREEENFSDESFPLYIFDFIF